MAKSSAVAVSSAGGANKKAAAAPAKKTVEKTKKVKKQAAPIDMDAPLKEVPRPVSSWSETIGSKSPYHQRTWMGTNKDGKPVKRRERIADMAPGRRVLWRGINRSTIIRLCQKAKVKRITCETVEKLREILCCGMIGVLEASFKTNNAILKTIHKKKGEEDDDDEEEGEGAKKAPKKTIEVRTIAANCERLLNIKVPGIQVNKVKHRPAKKDEEGDHKMAEEGSEKPQEDQEEAANPAESQE